MMSEVELGSHRQLPPNAEDDDSVEMSFRTALSHNHHHHHHRGQEPPQSSQSSAPAAPSAPSSRGTSAGSVGVGRVSFRLEEPPLDGSASGAYMWRDEDVDVAVEVALGRDEGEAPEGSAAMWEEEDKEGGPPEEGAPVVSPSAAATGGGGSAGSGVGSLGVGMRGASILFGGRMVSRGGDDEVVTMPRLRDHFSLVAPSSGVRFRTAHVRVYDGPTSQFVLEETPHDEDGDGEPDSVLTVKRVETGTTGLRALRASYTLVAVFCSGFLLIFSVMLLLFLFIDLASEAGLTDRSMSGNWMRFVSVLLSVPVFVYSLASGMAVVGSFVTDTWRGHAFLRTFGNWSVVVTEWISFAVYIGLPVVVMIFTLFMGMDDWWALSLTSWFACILLLFGFFAACVLYYDVSACLYLIDTLEDPIHGPLPSRKFEDLFRRAVLLTQSDRFGGNMAVVRTLAGKLHTADIEADDKAEGAGGTTYIGPYARLTLLGCCGRLFHRVDPPRRNFSIEEVCGVMPFVTKSTWSLEKIYCRNRQRGRQVAIMRGPSALTRHQARSSCACAVMGNALTILLFAALMAWMGGGAAQVVALLVVMLICCVPNFRSMYGIFNIYRQVFDHVDSAEGEEGGGDGQMPQSQPDSDRGNLRRGSVTSEAIYTITESLRITSPHPTLCHVAFSVEVVFLFLWPVVFLFASGNRPGGALFLIMGVFSGARHYLNAAVVLKELGSFGTLGEKSGSARGVFGVDLTPLKLRDRETDDMKWKAKSRLTTIVRNITRGRARSAFAWFFFFFVLLCLILVFTGVISGGNGGVSEEASKSMKLVHDFEYKERPDLAYPTCRMGKGLRIPGLDNITDMIDYVFLASVAYNGENNTQTLLNEWFGGEGRAINNPGVVDRFKEENGEFGESQVHYKFVTFSGVPGYGIVVIRGTTNSWDILTDGKLWGAAALFQGLRALLPLGNVFTPILHKVVRFVSVLETESIERVSYYKETSAFTDWLWRSGNFTTIHITGHSLGGGLALITGSQTNTPAVGLSAPNTVLTRDTLTPRVTRGQLNNLTFNIVPRRDLVPMIDDKANLYQMIECRAPANRFQDCHMSVRSLCEIMYSCGTGGRPVLCLCAEELGYPLPDQTGDRTFEDACKLED